MTQMEPDPPLTDDAPPLLVIGNCIGARFPLAAGLPGSVDSMRARMIRSLNEAPGPSNLPREERESLANSLAMALTRAEYHTFRFNEIMRNLEEHRQSVRAPFMADLTVTYAIYEAAAVLGAARLAVDEVVHITARIHGAADAAAADKQWKASDVVNDEEFAKKTRLDVDELRLLRGPGHREWFTSLNEYRNVLFHRGWRDIYGQYHPLKCDARRPTAPGSDALLVPDLASLANKAKPSSWTYTKRLRLESVVAHVMDGLRAFLDAVCEGVWKSQTPAPGRVPADQDFNALYPLPHPWPHVDLKTRQATVLLFTSEDDAQYYPQTVPVKPKGCVLRELPLDPSQKVFTFSVDHLTKLLDPDLIIDPKLGVNHIAGVRLPITFNRMEKAQFVGVLRASIPHIDRLWCWAIDTMV